MKISVIICTHNRAYAIEPCLNSIAQAMGQVELLDAEIVVVDNASDDDTSECVRRWAEESGAVLNLVYEPRKGLARARNTGIDAARGELLIFTDDDCRMDVDYIVEALRYDEHDEEPVFRGGRVELGNPEDLPLSIKADDEKQRWHKSDPEAKHMEFGNAVVGCNMLMRKCVAETVGAFDERFGAGTDLPGGEDLDYIYRAYLADIPVEYVPDMVVHHFHGRQTPEEGTKLLRGYFIGEGALYAKFLFVSPSLCRTFYWDLKKMIKEIRTGKRLYRPDREWLDISYKTIVSCNIKGMGLFMVLCIRSLFKPSQVTKV